MKRGKTSESILKVKPSALKTDISMLFEMFFQNQQQVRDGWVYLKDGAFKRRIM